MNGTSEGNGVLEVCYLGNWGKVCLTKFGKQDASVACKQMGYTSNGKSQETITVSFIITLFVNNAYLSILGFFFKYMYVCS